MLLLAALALPVLIQSPVGMDSDRDGLSDFDEIHKYFTDPHNRDTDGDGVPDGDWEERREYAYSVDAVMRVLPPINVASLTDDYQDGRVLRARKDYVEIEVVCYPLNTVGEAIGEDKDWRSHIADLEPWTKSGPTSNWDSRMRSQIRAELAKLGIDDWKVSDRALVEQVSHWLLERARSENTFTTFDFEFVDGRPRIAPGLEDVVARELAQTGRSLADQLDREMFGKGMYENRVHGTCTSAAIYLATCFRAIGMPTRTILCIPVIDASDPTEVALVGQHVTHNRVRRTIARAARRAGGSWTSHTFNEVWIDGRWRRLNYERLGQNILDEDYLGLMVHVNTFRDFAESGLVAWGMRAARDHEADEFGGANPYSCVELSDEFGAHAKIENPVLPEHHVLTIARAYWAEDPSKPAGVTLEHIDDPKDGGHMLVHVDEVRADDDQDQYADFYAAVDKAFVLRAAGHPDVQARAARGFWAKPSTQLREFYVHVVPAEFAKMERGVPYELVPHGTAGEHVWKVAPGVTITRP